MKRIKFLLIMCGVLIILVLAYLITLTLTKDDNNPDDNGDDNTGAPLVTTYTVAKIDINSLYALSYTINGASYNFTLNDTRDAWIWSENLRLPLDNTYFAAMAQALALITSDVKLAADKNTLSEYGLTEPWLTITVSDEVNGLQTFKFGRKNNYNLKYYFMSSSDKDFVFMVDGNAAEPFGKNPLDMIKNSTLPVITASGITSIAFSTSIAKAEYKYYPDGKDGDSETYDLWYRVLGAEEIRLDDESSLSLSDEISSLAFGDLVGMSDADRQKYGFDRPVTLTISYVESKAVTDSSTGETAYVNVNSTLEIELGSTDGNDAIYSALPDSVLIYRISGKVLTSLYQSFLVDTTSIGR